VQIFYWLHFTKDRVTAVFESLSDKLQSVFDQLARQGKLSEADVNAAMREVRLALLEADVNFKVVKDFVARVKERAIGSEVMNSLTPAQQVVKIVNEELIELLGTAEPLNLSGPPPIVIMLVGLQGAGKTTMAAKLALRLRQQGQRPLMVAATSIARLPSNSLKCWAAKSMFLSTAKAQMSHRRRLPRTHCVSPVRRPIQSSSSIQPVACRLMNR
jgi:signal recognition particle GTPase